MGDVATGLDQHGAAVEARGTRSGVVGSVATSGIISVGSWHDHPSRRRHLTSLGPGPRSLPTFSMLPCLSVFEGRRGERLRARHDEEEEALRTCRATADSLPGAKWAGLRRALELSLAPIPWHSPPLGVGSEARSEKAIPL